MCHSLSRRHSFRGSHQPTTLFPPSTAPSTTKIAPLTKRGIGAKNYSGIFDVLDQTEASERGAAILRSLFDLVPEPGAATVLLDLHNMLAQGRELN